MRAIESKMIALILGGTKGDLRQNLEGGFVYWPREHEFSQTEANDLPVLVELTYSDGPPGYEMRLTPYGARFILENLYDERSKREIAYLHGEEAKS